ncbi:hypothetical protein Baya_12372 [Bagarius yarrelli]|uniref:Uncharacterized protein n=1 Tax=Bagarius yarrelli TaxID=175774 RepID=A0A556V2I0_BAGYA|nr:hypothetical protein Baya_12372 [Bagarius yarrelli]
MELTDTEPGNSNISAAPGLTYDVAVMPELTHAAELTYAGKMELAYAAEPELANAAEPELAQDAKPEPTTQEIAHAKPATSRWLTPSQPR